MKWFRFYSEVLNDPKVQLLHDRAYRAWTQVLCLANDGTPRGRIDPAIIPYALRMDQERADKMVEHFLERGLLEREGDKLVPHNWDGRQFASDNVTERSRQHRGNVARNGSRNVAQNVRGNVARNDIASASEADTETDTETDTENPQTPASGGRAQEAEDQAFDLFMTLVVRREPGRTKAREAWDKARKRGATAQQIIDGMRAARPAMLACEDKTKLPHVTTWLNQSRWEEPPAMPGERPVEQEQLSPEDEERRAAADEQARERRREFDRQLEAERERERSRIATVAAQQEDAAADYEARLAVAEQDPERPSNVDPAIWANIHPDRRPHYAKQARRMLELEAEDAAREAARSGEATT